MVGTAFFGSVESVRLFEHPDVPRNGREGQFKWLCQFVDGCFGEASNVAIGPYFRYLLINRSGARAHSQVVSGSWRPGLRRAHVAGQGGLAVAGISHRLVGPSLDDGESGPIAVPIHHVWA